MGRRRRRWGVLLASGMFHALLVALFVLDLNRAPVATAPPPMNVWLERPAPPPRTSSKSSPKAASPASSSVAPRAAAAPITVPDIAAAPSPSTGMAEAPAADLRGLGGLGGCRLATLDRLTGEARARCQERMAQAMGDGRAPRPNFDPTGRFARDARPYLTRPPKNGCKPVAAVKDEVTGQTSATIGIGCAWSF